MALFGEKYGDEVRVVSMGGVDGAEGDAAAAPYSMELCGGTHVRRTGDVGFFRIVGESAVAAGVRRIEALTGEAAVAAVAEQETWLLGVAAALKVAPGDLESRVVALLEERKKLECDLSEARRTMVGGGGNGAGNGGADKQVAGVTFAPRCLIDVPAKELKPMADEMKARMSSGVVALVAVNEGKASLVVSISDDLTERFDAVSLVRIGAEILGGKGGGGRPDMAQAGGPDGAKAAQALEAIEKALAG
jgi:alanyl-tRNA synthetase